MSPGTAVGAGGASTEGENGLGAPGSRRGAFSVGLVGGVVVVVVVVVVDVSGAFSSSLAHDAVKYDHRGDCRAAGDSSDAATQS